MDDQPKALYVRYDTIPETGISFPTVPKHIKDNLAYSLRPYQSEAIGRWLHYLDHDKNNKTTPVQLLFNMATGSGKTLIMAALILDLYKRGYRNFIYFVNSNNIIEKTRDNFTNPASSKFLFANNILIDGKPVKVRDVTTFSDIRTLNSNSINILFTTIQGLHSDLNLPHENRLTYHDLENQKIVLIGDEAHHNNSKTLMSKEDLADNRSWESTIDHITSFAKDPVLLEFTATIDLEDKNIYQKYHDRVIYKYNLKHFRSDGYSKDVLIYHVDSDLEARMLQAIIISQYRKKVALRYHIWLKPVVLFKSRTIADNESNYQTFTKLIKNLSAAKLLKQKQTATNILAEAFAYLDPDLPDLAEELKNDFMPERLLLVDGNNISGQKQLQLNSLEDRDNEIRAVFAVDMLNEGWDVLNLFDIVRLYDTRDAKNNNPGKTTIREAQLIGRGARYFPFVTDDPDQKYFRKFDYDETAELRLLEQLHYHSANNPKYIQELRQALISSGILAENYQEHTLHLKKSFKDSLTYKTGKIYLNHREPLADRSLHRNEVNPARNQNWDFRGQLLEVKLPTNLAEVVTVFDEQGSLPNTHKYSTFPSGSARLASQNHQTSTIEHLETVVKKVIPSHIMRHAMRRNKTFRFDYIQQKMPSINSVDDFIKSSGELALVIHGDRIKQNGLTNEQKLCLAERVLLDIDSRFIKNDKTYVGTTEFFPVNISELFKDHIKRKYFFKNGALNQESGVPQTYAKNPKYKLALHDKNWYIYDENYGNEAEKTFVAKFNDALPELSKIWSDIYLLRNEKIFKIYSFDDGCALEPDFVLLALDQSSDISWQIFITTNSDPLSGKDQWKKDFLAQIQKQQHIQLATDKNNDSNPRITSLAFDCNDLSKDKIINALKKLLGQ